MRTRKEIVERVKVLVPSAEDSDGVMVGLLVFFLQYRDAAPYLQEGVTREAWNENRHARTDQRVRLLLGTATRAAWKVANARQAEEIGKCFALLDVLCWLLGDEDHAWFRGIVDDRARLAYYGKPQFVQVHERFDLGPWGSLDDDRWWDKAHEMNLPAETALRRWRARWDPSRVWGSNGRE